MSRVLVPLAQGCEEIEAVTMIDLLRRAGIEVTTAALGSKTIEASRGVCLVADKTLDNVDIDEFDMIALPGGGPGAENLKNDSRIGAILQTYAMQEKWIAAICAAPKVLAAAGILDGKKATSYPGILEAEDLPTTELTQNPVQVDGKVITSRGPGTAMDFALTLIEVLAGSEKRTEVETPLQRPVA